jgi:hypothetical protein
MIRKLSSGQYRLYSRKTNPTTGKRRNLGTFKTRAAAEKHEREVQYFKRHWRIRERNAWPKARRTNQAGMNPGNLSAPSIDLVRA